MTAKDLKDRIMLFTDDIEFYYGDEHSLIVPLAKDGIESFDACWRETIKTYQSIEDLMADTLYDGKCLNEIAGEIELI